MFYAFLMFYAFYVFYAFAVSVKKMPVGPVRAGGTRSNRAGVTLAYARLLHLLSSLNGQNR